MKVTASLANAHVTPRKARLVAGLIRGLGVTEARVQLEKSVKKTSLPMLKLLESAVANAEHNFSLSRESLRVVRVDVNEGQKLKRWMPRAQGRATPLWHRLSHMSVVIEGVAAKSTSKKSPKVQKTASVKEEQTEGSEGKTKSTTVKKKAESVSTEPSK